MNCTVTYARKYEENYTTNTDKTMLWNYYKQFMKVRLTYYGKTVRTERIISNNKQDIAKISFKGMLMYYVYVTMEYNLGSMVA
jgi:hypothetical protein